MLERSTQGGGSLRKVAPSLKMDRDDDGGAEKVSGFNSLVAVQREILVVAECGLSGATK